MVEERDELIERAARALSPLPPVRGGAVARVLMAVRANRARPLPRWRRIARWFGETEQGSVPAKVAGLLIAASLAVGFVARGTFGTDGPVPSMDAGSVALQPAANTEAGTVPVALGVQLANAKTVAVVGDFNGWDPRATPMERVGDTGFWSATVRAKPGRHTYAYLVDGTTLMPDPRAPRARNPDFDGDASVLMVRTP